MKQHFDARPLRVSGIAASDDDVRGIVRRVRALALAEADDIDAGGPAEPGDAVKRCQPRDNRGRILRRPAHRVFDPGAVAGIVRRPPVLPVNRRGRQQQRLQLVVVGRAGEFVVSIDKPSLIIVMR